MIKLANADELPPNKECSELLTPSEAWKCLFVEWAYPTLTKPILFIESSYDRIIIEGVGIKCPKKGHTGYTLSECKDWEMEAI